jgi:hypothetical protein
MIFSYHYKIDSLILAALNGSYETIIVLNMNQESDTRSCLSATVSATILLGGLIKNRLFAAIAVS